MGKTLRKILVPIDGSEPGWRALDRALALSTATGSVVDVVTVLDLRQLDIYDGVVLSDEQRRSLETRIRTAVLDPANARAERAGRTISARLLKGPIERTLLDEAKDASLVVVGRTGKSMFERFVEGSISRALTQHSPAPIMIVP